MATMRSGQGGWALEEALALAQWGARRGRAGEEAASSVLRRLVACRGHGLCVEDEVGVETVGCSRGLAASLLRRGRRRGRGERAAWTARAMEKTTMGGRH